MTSHSPVLVQALENKVAENVKYIVNDWCLTSSGSWPEKNLSNIKWTIIENVITWISLEQRIYWLFTLIDWLIDWLNDLCWTSDSWLSIVACLFYCYMLINTYIVYWTLIYTINVWTKRKTTTQYWHTPFRSYA